MMHWFGVVTDDDITALHARAPYASELSRRGADRAPPATAIEWPQDILGWRPAR